MKKSLLLICATLIAGLCFQSCEKSKMPAPAVVNVSGLFSITGNWSTLGIDSRAALKFAAEDINAYLETNKANFRLSVSFYDTRLDPVLARQQFLAAASSGTRFIIGPQSSAELGAIASSADSARTIVISQGSTAGSLAIAGDPVFRFCPNDKIEGAAIANTIVNDGIRGLVTVARDDAGNLGLQSATKAAFLAKGGGTVNSFAAYSTAITDFAPVVTAIRASVSALASTYGVTHTAVYLASFDEGAALMALASHDSVLSNVRWYGADGVALSAALLANTQANEFAIKTGFFAPSFGLPQSMESKWKPLADRITASTGIEPDAFALAAYDAMWVIAHTLENTQGSTADFTRLKTTFAQQSNNYIGVTGSTSLDSYGDRASGAFDYWGIVRAGAGYKWSIVGKSE
jgi:branched-chain amino acid transport system substrate-binding protein